MIPRAGVFFLLIGILAVTPSGAHGKGKPHCRDLTFSGSAGPLSADKIALRVTDSAGTPIETSCKLQVQPNESGRSYAARLVALWGDGSGVVCPDPGNPPNPLPTRSCGNHPVDARSCRHKFKFKPDRSTPDPDDGLVRIRICCKDGRDCHGANAAANVPVSVQSKKDPAVTFIPSVPPVAGPSITGLAIDPIDMVQLPGGSQLGCRKDLALAVADHARRTLDALEQQVPFDPSSEDKLRAIAAKCGAGESPIGSLGFGICPAPCQGILINVCTAGTTGAPCNTATDCDTVPGNGDGECTEGSWNQVADCLVCQNVAAMNTVYNTAYGTGPDPTPEAEHCQDTIGKAVLDFVSDEIRETIRCQKLLDAGRAALPTNPPGVCAASGGGPCTLPPCICEAPPLALGRPCTADADCSVTPTCKRADLVGKRARSAAAFAGRVVPDCPDPVVPLLDACGTDTPSLVACLTDAGEQAGRTVADAMFPEGRASP